MKAIFFLIVGIILFKSGFSEFSRAWQLVQYQKTDCTIVQTIPGKRESNITLNGKDYSSYCPSLLVSYHRKDTPGLMEDKINLECVRGTEAQTSVLKNYDQHKKLTCWYGNAMGKEVILHQTFGDLVSVLIKMIFGGFLIYWGIIRPELKKVSASPQNNSHIPTQISPENIENRESAIYRPDENVQKKQFKKQKIVFWIILIVMLVFFYHYFG